jgi:hypothetical protein
MQYHYRRHVLGHELIKKYRILWQGTNYNIKTEKAASKPHTYLAISVLAMGTSDAQRAELLVHFNKIPFLWYEASNPSYYAELFVPITSYTEFLRSISALSRRIDCELKTFILDQSNGLRFSIAYRLFEPENRKWQLNSADVLARFRNLMVNVNNSSGDM